MLGVLREMMAYLRPYKKLSSLFMLTSLLDLAFLSLAPLSFKFIIDKAIEPRDFGYFWFILKVLGISGVVCLLCGIASDYLLARINTLVQTDLRKKLFEHLQHLSIDFFNRKRPGELVSGFTDDLPTIEGSMSAILTTGIQSFVVVTVSLVTLFYLQWSMALLILAGAALIFAGPYLLGRRAQAVFESHREQLAALSSDVQENVMGQKVIKGFNLQTAIIAKFQERLQALSLSGYRKNVMNARLGRAPMISLLLVNFAIIGFGSYLALKGYITVGALVAFFTMYTSMGNAVFNLAAILPAFTEAQVSMNRIGLLLRQPRELRGVGESVRLDEPHAGIRTKEVRFGYNEEQPVLDRISMTIPFGASVAFVGTSGSGKSTMVQLLLGFYEPDQGCILISGANLSTLDRGAYREQIGIVFQDNFLFRGTLLDNIRLGKPDASREEIEEAAKKAEIHDYICGLPDGYETQIADGGGNLSGGQKQRIAIARAIVRNPAILLLDEATSALDPISEEAVNRTFGKLSAGRTVITVTHRLSSVTGADRIYVFDRGALVESGSHLELLGKNGFYKELWDKQSGLDVSEDGQEASIDAERMSRLPFFKGVDRTVLGEIADLFHTETFLAGQSVIREGDPGDKFYLIARGRVVVTKQTPEKENVRLAVLEDGDHFGEIALLDNVPRTATVTTLTPCVLLTLKRKTLVLILSHYPSVDAYVRQTLRERKN